MFCMVNLFVAILVLFNHRVSAHWKAFNPPWNACLSLQSINSFILNRFRLVSLAI
jgi:hypothetical protein